MIEWLDGVYITDHAVVLQQQRLKISYRVINIQVQELIITTTFGHFGTRFLGGYQLSYSLESEPEF